MFIDPVSYFYSSETNFAANIEDIREFLYYFKKSSMLQYYILSQFKSKMMMEKHIIKKEIEEIESGKKNKIKIE